MDDDGALWESHVTSDGSAGIPSSLDCTSSSVLRILSVQARP